MASMSIHHTNITHAMSSNATRGQLTGMYTKVWMVTIELGVLSIGEVESVSDTKHMVHI